MTTTRLLRALALLLVVALVAGACGSSGPTREEVRGFLDSTYEADPNRAGTWLSAEAVKPTADRIAARVKPRDRVAEQEAEFMREGDYAVAVFPEATGSRVELDEYSQVRNRYFPIIGGFWGGSPISYGPRGGPGTGGGVGGGGFRGGGAGAGK